MKQHQPLMLRKIQQKDNYTFTIEWKDGLVGNYRLSELQMRCPCAACIDEATGKRRTPTNSIDPTVRAIKIVSVGRYALRVHFTSGCSTGIYDFDMLYGMAKGVVHDDPLV